MAVSIDAISNIVNEIEVFFMKKSCGFTQIRCAKTAGNHSVKGRFRGEKGRIVESVKGAVGVSKVLCHPLPDGYNDGTFAVVTVSMESLAVPDKTTGLLTESLS